MFIFANLNDIISVAGQVSVQFSNVGAHFWQSLDKQIWHLQILIESYFIVSFEYFKRIIVA